MSFVALLNHRLRERYIKCAFESMVNITLTGALGEVYRVLCYPKHIVNKKGVKGVHT